MRDLAGDDRRRKDCILVVEDEYFIAMELQAALIDGGFEVLGPVGSVSDALTLLASHRPDAAVLDFNLGKETVAPVASRLKEMGVSFVLATATNQIELAKATALDGAPNVGKPTDMDRLIALIRALLA